jgi:DNA-binding IclR family transcriptional regulator
VRETGWAAEAGEVTPGLASIGVAVLDHVGWPAAAIAVTYPDDSPRTLPAAEIAGAVRAAADELGRRIGAARGR